MKLLLMVVVFFMGLSAASYAGLLGGSLIAVVVSVVKGRWVLVAPSIRAALIEGISPLICGLVGWWLSESSEKMWLSFHNGVFVGLALSVICAPIQAIMALLRATMMIKTAKE